MITRIIIRSIIFGLPLFIFPWHSLGLNLFIIHHNIIIMDFQDKDHQEGTGTEAIENQTAKIPSDYFLFAAGAAMVVSLGFKLAKQNSKSLFVGQWVAPLLLFGVYNKIVKVLGHDAEDQPND